VKFDRLGFACQRATDEEAGREVLAVLTQDAAGLYAVYVGIVKPAHPGAAATADAARAQDNAEWVARHGSKQTWKKAEFFFTGIKEEEYGK
jgi:hypothetical protein